MLPQPISNPTPEMLILLFIGDHAAYGLGVTKMTVGADCTGDDVADAHAVPHLRDGGLIVLSEDLQRRLLEFRRLRRQFDRQCGGLTREVLGARGIAKRTPHRHGALAGPLDPGIRIKASSGGEFAGALFVRVRSAHRFCQTWT